MNGAPDTVVVIPARYGSSRLPGKPLADIGGKPMIQHVVERAGRAACVSRVIVATDDERIADAVRAFGGEAVITPVDCASGSDRIALVARTLAGTEIVVNVQGDEPLLPPGMIDEAVQLLVDDPTLEAATLVRRIDREEEITSPHVPKVVLARNGDCLYFSRSAIPFLRDIGPGTWSAHQTFYKHIGLYAYRRAFLLRYATLPATPLEQAEKLEQLRILEHGYRIRAAVTTYDSVPVDTPADLERARTLATQTS